MTLDAYNKTKAVGKRCNIQVNVGGRVFHREAVAQPGEEISWTAMLSFDPYDEDEQTFLFRQIRLKKTMSEEEVHYMPPCMEDGHFKQAVSVSQGTVVEAEVASQSDTSGPEPHSEEAEVEIVHADEETVVVEDETEKSLVPEQSTPSVLSEAKGEMHGGSADKGTEEELNIENIVNSESREKFAEATKADDTLAVARTLADMTAEGYHMRCGFFLCFTCDLDGLYKLWCAQVASSLHFHVTLTVLCIHTGNPLDLKL